MHSFSKFLCMLFGSILLSSCGVSDYINRKKITSAPVYKAPPQTSECNFNSRRIERVTSYLNKIRSTTQVCGGKPYTAAATVHWNNKLSIAAKDHSNDMAENNFLDHKGSRGLVPSDRVSNTNYDWKTVAENIAGGADTPEQTIEQWLTSPGHCHNIMNPAHSEFALACTRNNISDYRIYWTLVLASPKEFN